MRLPCGFAAIGDSHPYNPQTPLTPPKVVTLTLGCGGAAVLIYTPYHPDYILLLLKIRAHSKDVTSAAVIPADIAVNPPVKAPSRPFSVTAFAVPFAS